MPQLLNKKILLGITGGIAAYKTPDIVRRLRDQGAEVKVVMTEAAKRFITPLTLQAVSGNVVYDDLWDPTAMSAMAHIELARFADLIVVAPASADTIASLAYGFANDLLSTICLASEAPLVIVPAMNQKMWQNRATQANVCRLVEHGCHIIGPDSGQQACGEIGPGRLMEPDELVKQIEDLLNKEFQKKTAYADKKNSLKNSLLQNVNVLITAGPTKEAIDPVRYFSNHSSGKMGYALAEAAVAAGAKVTLISGPVSLLAPSKVNLISVTTAMEMYSQVIDNIQGIDVFIAAAAVSDYRCENPADLKLTKTSSTLSLQLIPNPDILKKVAALAKPPFTVGFAAQTHQLLEYARCKLQEKNISMVVANEIGKPDRGFAVDENAVTVLWQGGEKNYSLRPKNHLAKDLIQLIAERYDASYST